MISQRRQQQPLLLEGTGARTRRAQEVGGERSGLLARLRQATTRGSRERLQRALQHQDSIKRRELTYEEDAWARHGSSDYGDPKLRHMQVSEGTTQVSADDYGELPEESEEEYTGHVEASEEGGEEGVEEEDDEEKQGLYAYAYAELQKRLRGHRKRADEEVEAGAEEEEAEEEKDEVAAAVEDATASELTGGEWYYGTHVRQQRRAREGAVTPTATTRVLEKEDVGAGEEEEETPEDAEEVGEAVEVEDDEGLVQRPEEGEEQAQEEEEFERQEPLTYAEEEEDVTAAVKAQEEAEEGEEVETYEDAWQTGDQEEEDEGHVDMDYGGEAVAEGDETAEVEVEEEELPEEDEGGWEREAAGDEEDADEKAYEVEEKEADEGEEEEEYEVGGSLGGEDEEEQVAEVEGGAEEDDAAEEPPKEDVTPYTLPQIEERVEVRHVVGKGRCLYTRNALEPGSIVFVETPVFVATPSAQPELWQALEQLNEEEAFELPPVWHLGALCCLTLLDEEKKAICLDKWIPEPDKEPSDDVVRVLERTGLSVHPQLYERMLMVWRYNSFGHHSEQPGLVLYNRISMMAHSCSASACWHYGEGDAFILRARIKLNAGDELTISYIGDEDLYKSTEVRREKVSGWLFTCQCPRCSLPVDNARGFRCSACATGSMFFKTEYGVTTSSPCTVCQSVPSDEIIKYYLEFEQAYVDRLAETDKSDLADAKLVFFQAQRVFNQHWVLYQLHTILFEGHRDGGAYEVAAFHQMERIKYVSQVMPLASYTLAWLHEELGDTLMSKEDQSKSKSYSDHKLHLMSGCFEDAYNLLYILCGKDHEYTIAADAKKTTCDQKLAALTNAPEEAAES